MSNPKRKRGYSRDFTPRSETYGRYLLDKIPATLWHDVRAKAKRDGVSVRVLILSLLRQWIARRARRNESDETVWCPRCEIEMRCSECGQPITVSEGAVRVEVAGKAEQG